MAFSLLSLLILCSLKRIFTMITPLLFWYIFHPRRLLFKLKVSSKALSVPFCLSIVGMVLKKVSIQFISQNRIWKGPISIGYMLTLYQMMNSKPDFINILPLDLCTECVFKHVKLSDGMVLTRSYLSLNM